MASFGNRSCFVVVCCFMLKCTPYWQQPIVRAPGRIGAIYRPIARAAEKQKVYSVYSNR